MENENYISPDITYRDARRAAIEDAYLQPQDKMIAKWKICRILLETKKLQNNNDNAETRNMIKYHSYVLL